MAVMDEFKEEREKIKSAPLSKKIRYFLDYYKLHTCAVLIIIVVIATFVNTYLTKTETVLSCAVINTKENTLVAEQLIKDTEDLLEIAGEKESIAFDNTYYLDYVTQDYNHSVSVQKIVTVISAKTLDIIAADDSTYGYLAYGGYLMNLESILSEEEWNQYKDQFYYVDGAVIDEIHEMESMSEEFPEFIFGKPEDMKSPIAVGICAKKDSMLARAYGYSEDGVIGIVTNTLQSENAVAFLKLALEENE